MNRQNLLELTRKKIVESAPSLFKLKVQDWDLRPTLIIRFLFGGVWEKMGAHFYNMDEVYFSMIKTRPIAIVLVFPLDLVICAIPTLFVRGSRD